MPSCPHCGAAQPGPEVRTGDVVLLVDDGVLIGGGRRIRLTRTESMILAALMRYPGRVLSRADLHRAADMDGDGQAVPIHVLHLRRKLAGVVEIRNNWGIGYFVRKAGAPEAPDVAPQARDVAPQAPDVAAAEPEPEPEPELAPVAAAGAPPQDERGRLVAEAIAAGRLRRLPPAYAAPVQGARPLGTGLALRESKPADPRLAHQVRRGGARRHLGGKGGR